MDGFLRGELRPESLTPLVAVKWKTQVYAAFSNRRLHAAKQMPCHETVQRPQRRTGEAWTRGRARAATVTAERSSAWRSPGRARDGARERRFSRPHHAAAGRARRSSPRLRARPTPKLLHRHARRANCRARGSTRAPVSTRVSPREARTRARIPGSPGSSLHHASCRGPAARPICCCTRP